MGDHLKHMHKEATRWRFVIEELSHHFPYAIFSVVLSIIAVGILSHVVIGKDGKALAHELFHGFHVLHLLFSGTGVVLMYRKYSSGIIGGVAVGLLVPTFFCTLSDVFIPYFAGQVLDLSISFHWCFRDHLFTVLPFLLVGVINGLVMSQNQSQRFYLLSSHFLHILISSMASILYLISFGLIQLWESINSIFIFLIAAVLIPCTFSDVIVPMWFARCSEGNGAAKGRQGCRSSCGDAIVGEKKHERN
jgi:hypothetical protein